MRDGSTPAALEIGRDGLPIFSLTYERPDGFVGGLHRYRDAARPNPAELTLETFGFRDLGYLQETLTDALHLLLLLEGDEDVRRIDPSFLHPAVLPPAYVLDYFGGDYRGARSYWRGDRGA